jgi:hypothetical protein
LGHTSSGCRIPSVYWSCLAHPVQDTLNGCSSSHCAFSCQFLRAFETLSSIHQGSVWVLVSVRIHCWREV